MSLEALALACIAWYIFIALVCVIGYIQLFINYRTIPARAAVLSKDEDEIPHVTAIRPCKGLEPYLYECLAATLQQDYPCSKLTIHFCVSSKHDPAYTTAQKVLYDHPHHDATLYVEEEDPNLQAGNLGPNPKIRNMSRAYREAKGDIVWIIDCNVWVNPGACGRMVDKLCGYTHHPQKQNRPYKLVHHLPISVDVPSSTLQTSSSSGRLYDSPSTALSSLSTAFGGRLEELFLSSSHAKMYVAINTVAIAPCIVGKSTMFRRSHLNLLTTTVHKGSATLPPPSGLDYFSHNICEDHLIGDLLWKSHLPLPTASSLKYANHGLVLGDLAIQPVAAMSVANYIARRVRWLRVRKFTVPTATLVEPGTESILCSAMGAWGVTTSRLTSDVFGGAAGRWRMLLWFVGSLVLWAAVDWTVHVLLHSGKTVEVERSKITRVGDAKSESTVSISVPEFARPPSPSLPSSLFRTPRRPFVRWLRAWLGREVLALPIWAWAIWGGVSVTWRERRFWVGWDMKVHEILETSKNGGEVVGTKVTRSSNGTVGENDLCEKQAQMQRDRPRRRVVNEKEMNGEVWNGHGL